MAFHGDLSSYPLPDLLQWLDASRKTGALQLTWDNGSRRLFVLSGQVVATATPGLWERLARVLDHGREASGHEVMTALRTSQQPLDAAVALSLRQLAEEELVAALGDITQTPGGQFHWTEDPDRGEDEWVNIELSLRAMLFESLRRLDEAADVERVLSQDSLMARALPGPPAKHSLHRVILSLASADGGVSLGRLWLQLGLSKSVVMRNVFELLRGGRLVVEGAALLETDPVAEMLEKGAMLLRERQFDAASLVFSTLLQSDPSDRRVRAFARMAEREHAAALYRDLPPVSMFVIEGAAQTFSQLRPEERRIVEQLQSGWDVSAVVLASGLREIDTLKALQKLVRMGLARLQG